MSVEDEDVVWGKYLVEDYADECHDEGIHSHHDA